MPAQGRGMALAYLRCSSSDSDFDPRRQLGYIISDTAKAGVVLDAMIDDLDHMVREGLKHYRGIVLENGFRPGKGPTG
jgi:hypothetical protein